MRLVKFFNGGNTVKLHYRSDVDETQVIDKDFPNINPAIIIENSKAKHSIYVIPLTTYELEKYKAWRKEKALRIKSTGAIVFSSRLEIICKFDIRYRVLNESTLLRITPKELKDAYDKINKYIYSQIENYIASH